jgi:hypothetical protein
MVSDDEAGTFDAPKGPQEVKIMLPSHKNAAPENVDGKINALIREEVRSVRLAFHAGLPLLARSR